MNPMAMAPDDLRRRIRAYRDELHAAQTAAVAEATASAMLELLPQLELCASSFSDEKDRDELWEAMRLATRAVTPPGLEREHRERVIKLRAFAAEIDANCRIQDGAGSVFVSWKARRAARAFLVEVAKLDLSRLDGADRQKVRVAVSVARAVASGENTLIKR